MMMFRQSSLSAAVASTVLVAAACASGRAASLPAQVTAINFPPDTPRWIVSAAARTARGLGDPRATLVTVSLGRFPIVVLKGNFICSACSRPSSMSTAPSGHFASSRFDGLTHQATDFVLSATRAAAMSSLCNGSPCTMRALYLDSAFRALYAHSRGVSEPFDHRVGRSHCKIRLPVSEMKWIWGGCSVAMQTEPTKTVVTFREDWNGLDASGHRYSWQAPRRRHVFVVTETRGGFATSFRSTGDYPPQWKG